eukprot:Gb_12732 [translate_table: standard]
MVIAKQAVALGYGWAAVAGTIAAMAAVIAKAVSSQFDWRLQLLSYACVVLLNVSMWSCYVNSLKALTSLQATVVNFATNFLVSGFTGFFLFRESLHFQWFAGAVLIVLGTFILSQSSTEPDHGHSGTKSSLD